MDKEEDIVALQKAPLNTPSDITHLRRRPIAR